MRHESYSFLWLEKTNEISVQDLHTTTIRKASKRRNFEKRILEKSIPGIKRRRRGKGSERPINLRNGS
jgi:hypothetical protein